MYKWGLIFVVFICYPSIHSSFQGNDEHFQPSPRALADAAGCLNSGCLNRDFGNNAANRSILVYSMPMSETSELPVWYHNSYNWPYQYDFPFNWQYSYWW